MFELLQAGSNPGITWSPVALAIAIGVVLLVLLLIRFVVKSAVTLVKVALLVLIGVGAYLGFQAIL